MIRARPLLILPLVNHFVKQGVESLIPAVSPDMMPANYDFGFPPRLAPPHVVTQPALHAPGNSDRDAAELTSETRLVQESVVVEELAHEWLVRRVSPLGCADVTRAAARCRLLPWLEVKCKLELGNSSSDQSAERSKQR